MITGYTLCLSLMEEFYTVGMWGGSSYFIINYVILLDNHKILPKPDKTITAELRSSRPKKEK